MVESELEKAASESAKGNPGNYCIPAVLDSRETAGYSQDAKTNRSRRPAKPAEEAAGSERRRRRRIDVIVNRSREDRPPAAPTDAVEPNAGRRGATRGAFTQAVARPKLASGRSKVQVTQELAQPAVDLRGGESRAFAGQRIVATARVGDAPKALSLVEQRLEPQNRVGGEGEYARIALARAPLLVFEGDGEASYAAPHVLHLQRRTRCAPREEREGKDDGNRRAKHCDLRWRRRREVERKSPVEGKYAGRSGCARHQVTKLVTWPP